MSKVNNVEAEGGELVLKNSAGDYAIIPKKYRQEVLDMVKEGCTDCIDHFVSSLPVMDSYAEDGTLMPGWDKVMALINPKNWGVTDYSEQGDFGKAYAMARQNGETEFMFNNKRYSTQYAGTPAEQLAQTGITDEQMQDLNFMQERLAENLKPLGYKNMLGRVASAVLLDKKDSYRATLENIINSNDMSTVKKGAKQRLDAYYLYMGKPQKYDTFGISPYAPAVSEETDQIYYSVDDPEFRQQLVGDLTSDKPKREVVVKGNIMGYYTESLGSDERGDYISYYDKWDISPMDFGKPFEIYDRIYYKDYGPGKGNREMYYTDEELKNLSPDSKNFNTLALQNELANRGYKLPKSTKVVDNKWGNADLFTGGIEKVKIFDGVYGPETKQALIDWQSKNK